MNLVTIRQSGNLLEIENPPTKLLEPILSYDRKTMDYAGWGNTKITVENVSLYSEQNGKGYVLAGMLSTIMRVLKANGYTVVLNDLRSKKWPKPDYDHMFQMVPNLALREGQAEILAEIVDKDRGVFVAPTGFGKTFIIRLTCLLFPTAKIIISSPSRDIVQGTYRKLKQETPSLDIGRVGGGFAETGRRVTLCTIQSIMKADINGCDIFLYDEAHTAPSPTYSELIAKVDRAKMFGFTATPTGRSDGADIIVEALFGPTLYRVKYQSAVDAGMISKLKVRVFPVPEGNEYGSTYKVQAVKKRHCYWRNDIRNRVIAQSVKQTIDSKEVGDDPQVLVLVETVEHAFQLAQYLPDFPVVYANEDAERFDSWKKSGLIPAGTPLLNNKLRTSMLNDFEDGKLRRVIATSVWGTGVDFVNLDVLVYAGGAPGEIRSTQWPGRNSRIRDGKQFGLVIDFSDDWDKWAKGRAMQRLKTYKQHGWEIHCAPETNKVYRTR